MTRVPSDSLPEETHIRLELFISAFVHTFFGLIDIYAFIQLLLFDDRIANPPTVAQTFSALAR